VDDRDDPVELLHAEGVLYQPLRDLRGVALPLRGPGDVVVQLDVFLALDFLGNEARVPHELVGVLELDRPEIVLLRARRLGRLPELVDKELLFPRAADVFRQLLVHPQVDQELDVGFPLIAHNEPFRRDDRVVHTPASVPSCQSCKSRNPVLLSYHALVQNIALPRIARVILPSL
jgi:hypothetical protein